MMRLLPRSSTRSFGVGWPGGIAPPGSHSSVREPLGAIPSSACGDLRHPHATLLLADGANAKVVQERLGHHSHSFTADTYQHVMPGMDEAVASRFQDLSFEGMADEDDPNT